MPFRTKPAESSPPLTEDERKAEGEFVVRLFEMALRNLKARLANGDHPEDAASHAAAAIDAYFDAL